MIMFLHFIVDLRARRVDLQARRVDLRGLEKVKKYDRAKLRPWYGHGGRPATGKPPTSSIFG